MAAQQNATTDLSVLLDVPAKTLNILADKLNLCIGSIIHDALTNKEEMTVIDIGIGTLSVNLADMQCKFIPSKNLKATIKKCLNDNIDPLECELEKEFSTRLMDACNEVI